MNVWREEESNLHAFTNQGAVLPVKLSLLANDRVQTTYQIIPLRRGELPAAAGERAAALGAGWRRESDLELYGRSRCLIITIFRCVFVSRRTGF
jgi:hypothetical protein